MAPMSTPTPPLPALRLVVGYDGSPPANRALDAAVALLRGRTGHIDVMYVAHLTSTVMMSADAVAEMDTDFDEVETELRALAAEKLSSSGLDWSFGRRQGAIAEELIIVASATSQEHPGDTVVISIDGVTDLTNPVVGEGS